MDEENSIVTRNSIKGGVLKWSLKVVSLVSEYFKIYPQIRPDGQRAASPGLQCSLLHNIAFTCFLFNI
jgi:hypothetical protein